MEKKITLPLTEELARSLKAGDRVLLSGYIYTSRDAGHKRMCEALARGEELPIDPMDATIYYVGPTPAMLYTEIVPGDQLKITVGPKGFGSENMSAIRMFKPSAGLQGIKDFIIETVETAGPNPCPPMVVGVGIGGTFDKAALLAKKALMRSIDSENPDPFYADLEKEMLEKINQLGIGPQGFGGMTTAIGLNIETLPTHIAGMPCAININCHVTRHKSEVI